MLYMNMKSQQSTRWAWTLTLLLFCSHTCVATSGGWHDVIIIHQLHSLSPSFRMSPKIVVRCGEHWRICWDLLRSAEYPAFLQSLDNSSWSKQQTRCGCSGSWSIAPVASRDLQVSARKKYQKTSRPGFGKSICAICLQDASYSCEDKINMQLES